MVLKNSLASDFMIRDTRGADLADPDDEPESGEGAGMLSFEPHPVKRTAVNTQTALRMEELIRFMTWVIRSRR